MGPEPSNDRGFSISFFSSSLCSARQVHDYFCMTVAASVTSKQKQRGTMCRDKLERMIAELTWKTAFSHCPRTLQICLWYRQNWKQPAVFHNPTGISLAWLSPRYRLLRTGLLFVTPLKEEEVHQKEAEFWLNGGGQVKEQSPAGQCCRDQRVERTDRVKKGDAE